jgi:hypothetical protein
MILRQMACLQSSQKGEPLLRSLSLMAAGRRLSLISRGKVDTATWRKKETLRISLGLLFELFRVCRLRGCPSRLLRRSPAFSLFLGGLEPSADMNIKSSAFLLSRARIFFISVCTGRSKSRLLRSTRNRPTPSLTYTYLQSAHPGFLSPNCVRTSPPRLPVCGLFKHKVFAWWDGAASPLTDFANITKHG